MRRQGRSWGLNARRFGIGLCFFPLTKAILSDWTVLHRKEMCGCRLLMMGELNVACWMGKGDYEGGMRCE